MSFQDVSLPGQLFELIHPDQRLEKSNLFAKILMEDDHPLKMLFLVPHQHPVVIDVIVLRRPLRSSPRETIVIADVQNG